MTLLYFILLIGPLIFVHELGHFLFAKLFDVKVHKFSLGFGPKMAGFRKGETEYVVAWVPLGGYVKMLGEDPTDEIKPDDQGRAFNQKPLWQRYIIVLAGPAFNIIFPTIIYFVFFAAQTSLPPAVVGRVIAGQPAAEAGLRPGDRIVAIDGEEVRYWETMKDRIADHAGEPLRVTLEREGQRFDRYITPREHATLNKLNMVEREGRIGITPYFDLAQVGIQGPDTAAARAGLKTGDLITSANGERIVRWDQLERLLEANRGESLRVSFLRPTTSFNELVDLSTLTPGATVVDPVAELVDGRTVYRTGIHSAEFFVRAVEKDSPAHKIGIKPGAHIVRFNGKPVKHWELVKQELMAHRDAKHSVTWVPFGGERRTDSFKLVQVTETDEFQHERQRYVFGASNFRIWKSAEPAPIQSRFTYAAVKSVRQTAEIVGMMGIIVVQIVRGSIPRDTIGGPLMLAYTARAAAEKGWDHFIWILALISINLGIINLLPIPVLDGGHILFFSIEAAKRKPLSLRAREIATYIGLVLILSLLIFAFRNDIVRYWFK